MRARLVAAAVVFVAATVTPVAVPPSGAGASSTPGYWLFATDGGVFSFGAATFHGTTRSEGAELVGMAPTPSGAGYWLVDDDGDVFAHGDAADFGSRAAATDDIAAFAARPQADGYWMASRTGTVEAFGQAPALAPVTVPSERRVVAMAATSTGAGAWLAAVDGGVFALGDAPFLGSLGNVSLNLPLVGMVPTPSGRGYWLVAADGGIFTFGDAAFSGSLGDITLNRPVVGMAAVPDRTANRPGFGSAGGGGAAPPGGGTGRIPTTTTTTPPATTPPTTAPEVVATLVGAGDIASCNSSGDERTAALLDQIPGTVFTTGDNAYEQGSLSQYNNCYDGSWGRHKARTRPVVGNHEYGTTDAAGYAAYFGPAAGPAKKYWYSYDLGAWHVVVLNSNCWVVSCAVDSEQERWLRADLAASPAACTVALWHHPRFSSGSHGNDMAVQPLWNALYAAGAEVVLNGHDHTYERFAPQRPDGSLDPAHGIREFVIGSGGKGHYNFNTIKPNSEARNQNTDGVLRLTLRAGGYDWRFVPAAGGTYTDSGTGSCHGRPA